MPWSRTPPSTDGGCCSPIATRTPGARSTTRPTSRTPPASRWSWWRGRRSQRVPRALELAERGHLAQRRHRGEQGRRLLARGRGHDDGTEERRASVVRGDRAARLRPDPALRLVVTVPDGGVQGLVLGRVGHPAVQPDLL